jgi:hypothetical protein
MIRYAAALIILASPAMAGQWTVSSDGVAACISQEVAEKVAKLRAEQDFEAAAKLLGPLMLFGQCILLTRGETLNGDLVPNGWPMAWGSQWVSFRRKGNPADYIVAKSGLEQR